MSFYACRYMSLARNPARNRAQSNDRLQAYTTRTTNKANEDDTGSAGMRRYVVLTATFERRSLVAFAFAYPRIPDAQAFGAAEYARQKTSQQFVTFGLYLLYAI